MGANYFISLYDGRFSSLRAPRFFLKFSLPPKKFHFLEQTDLEHVEISPVVNYYLVIKFLFVTVSILYNKPAQLVIEKDR